VALSDRQSPSACSVEAVLARRAERWSLTLVSRPEWSPLEVDFGTARFSERSLRASGRSSPFARALALDAEPEPKQIVDATAGLGADAYVAAWLAARSGSTVTAFERNPVAYVLLADGLRRAPAGPARAALRLEFGDSAPRLEALAPDIVFLDPMFPDTQGKSALPRKGMPMFRALDRSDSDDEGRLFEAALAAAVQRVVVKRPPHAPVLLSASGRGRPDSAFASKTVRFDVYRKR
jgi:16S rRNA (guanine1516-N2)-methyltransferase